jgi:hypothetical protein
MHNQFRILRLHLINDVANCWRASDQEVALLLQLLQEAVVFPL